MMVVDRDQRAKSDVSYHQFLMDNLPVDPFDILLLNSLILHLLAKQSQQRFISILILISYDTWIWTSTIGK